MRSNYKVIETRQQSDLTAPQILSSPTAHSCVCACVRSIGVKYASRFVSDYLLLILSLLIGLLGSLLLVDGDSGASPVPLPLPRFFAGFVLITVAFPFGRNVSLSIFSKILGPTPQGTWFGYMFAAGALPRIVGPR